MSSLKQWAPAFLFTLMLSGAFSGVQGDPEVEDSVVVLTEANFDEWVNKQVFTLVEFYAPWCGHCKTLAPEWSKAAEALGQRDAPIYLAKVDATVHENLGKRFDVSGYPTIVAFRNGEKEEYNGPREADGIIDFVEKEGPPTYAALHSVAELDALVKENDVTVVCVARPPITSSKIFQSVKAMSKASSGFGFGVDSGSKLDTATRGFPWIPSEVGAKLGVEIGAVVFTNFGKDSTTCNIKAKLYSKKTLTKCVKDAITATKHQDL